jgi:hypothetical protein
MRSQHRQIACGINAIKDDVFGKRNCVDLFEVEVKKRRHMDSVNGFVFDTRICLNWFAAEAMGYPSAQLFSWIDRRSECGD